MKTSHYGLRLLIESILLEGFKEDQRYLIEKYPNQAQKLNELLPKWISWLAARFGEKPSKKETHPFEDAIVTIKNFSDKDKSIGDKYGTNPQFKSAVDGRFPPEGRTWKSPTDIMNMTADEMEVIIGFSERKKQRIEVTKDDENIERDRVGKVGPWNLWMPTSRGRSCKIAGYDPITLEPKTTWCTARIAGSNLFYSYVGRPGEEITLFYVIKDAPVEDNDWLSLGFVNGELKLDGEKGGISVNRANEGLDYSLLNSVLGNHRNEILAKLKEKNKQLGGKHPARQKIADAALSAKALNYLIKGLSEDETLDLVSLVIKEPTVADEVWVELSKNSKKGVRLGVARNPKTPPEILKTLAGDSDRGVRLQVARNTNTPPEALKTLAGDSDKGFRLQVAQNSSTPPEALKTLAGDSDSEVRLRVARHHKTPPEILKTLAMDSDNDVRLQVVENPNTPPEALKTLAGDSDSGVRITVAYNPRTPLEILKTLAGDSERDVRLQVAQNRSTPPEILKTLAMDSERLVKDTANLALKKLEPKQNESRLRELIRLMI